MFALSAVSSRNVACQASQPRHKGAKHHARSRPIKVRGQNLSGGHFVVACGPACARACGHPPLPGEGSI